MWVHIIAKYFIVPRSQWTSGISHYLHFLMKQSLLPPTHSLLFLLINVLLSQTLNLILFLQPSQLCCHQSGFISPYFWWSRIPSTYTSHVMPLYSWCCTNPQYPALKQHVSYLSISCAVPIHNIQYCLSAFIYNTGSILFPSSWGWSEDFPSSWGSSAWAQDLTLRSLKFLYAFHINKASISLHLWWYSTNQHYLVSIQFLFLV